MRSVLAADRETWGAVAVPHQVVVGALVVLAAFVRLVGLTARYVWRDEQIVADYVAQYGVVELPGVILVQQPHLPTYFVLVELWAETLPFVTARYPSVVGGLVAVVAGYRVACGVLDRQQSTMVLSLLVVSVPAVAASRWVRPYGLLCGAAAVSWLALVRVRDDPSRGWRVGYLAATLVAIAIHPLGLLAPVGQLAYVAVDRLPGGERSVVSWWSSGRLVWATLVPTLPLVGAWVVAKFAGVLGTINQVAHINELNALWIATVPGGLFVGRMIWPFQTWLALLLSALSLLGLHGWRTDSAARLAIAWGAVPFALAIAASLLHPVFGIKYLTWTAPAWAILIVRGFDALPTRVATVLSGLVTAGLAAGLLNYLLGAWAGARVAKDYLPPLL